MITLQEALKLISDNVQHLGILEVDLEESLGKILAENIYADRDYPPFNRSAMDGYACKFSDLSEIILFNIIEEIFAGQSPL